MSIIGNILDSGLRETLSLSQKSLLVDMQGFSNEAAWLDGCAPLQWISLDSLA